MASHKLRIVAIAPVSHLKDCIKSIDDFIAIPD